MLLSKSCHQPRLLAKLREKRKDNEFVVCQDVTFCNIKKLYYMQLDNDRVYYHKYRSVKDEFGLICFQQYRCKSRRKSKCAAKFWLCIEDDKVCIEGCHTCLNSNNNNQENFERWVDNIVPKLPKLPEVPETPIAFTFYVDKIHPNISYLRGGGSYKVYVSVFAVYENGRSQRIQIKQHQLTKFEVFIDNQKCEIHYLPTMILEENGKSVLYALQILIPEGRQVNIVDVSVKLGKVVGILKDGFSYVVK